MKTSEIYNSVTNKIIELLESHQLNWTKPWVNLGEEGKLSRNAISERYYTGVNQLLLSMNSIDKGYLKNTYITFNQVRKAGGKVIKGSKSAPVYFYKPLIKDKNGKQYTQGEFEAISLAQQNALEIKYIPILKQFNVFNIFQTEGLDETYYSYEKAEMPKTFQLDMKAEELITSSGVPYQFVEGNKAFYNPKADLITLPAYEQFKSQRQYYDTAFHELGHATGHKTRLNRSLVGSFGSVIMQKKNWLQSCFLRICVHHLVILNQLQIMLLI